MNDFFYFGCNSRPGHHLYSPDMLGSLNPENIKGWPWGLGGLDTTYPAGGANRDREGPATITHHKGWTVMAMWDKSVDKRNNCNAAFVARGTLNYDEMVRVAELHFSGVWRRINDRKVVHLLQNEVA